MRNLGIILPGVAHREDPWRDILYLFADVPMPVAAGLMAIWQSGHENGQGFTLTLTGIAFFAEAYLLIAYSKGSADSLINGTLFLIVISITALSVLNYSRGGDNAGTVRTIVSNYAAFSLWQVGSTCFERSEAMRELMRIYIAGNAAIKFH